MRQSFLGVESSALGFQWLLRCDEVQQRQALAISQQYGLPDVLSQVLAGRNIPLSSVKSFLEPKLKDLMPDPLVLRDMNKALDRLYQAIKGCEKVAIFGDYDVDGACSTALLSQYLNYCGLETVIYIPDRITEGYGPNVQAIESLHKDGAKLLVTVDCGTAGDVSFQRARQLGLDVIVLDHHQAPDTLPDISALVNPNRQDDLSGLGFLCAAGVVFLVLVAFNRYLREKKFWKKSIKAEPNLLEQLDLVALATIADISPLIQLNRAFVRQGLMVIKSRKRIGLSALLDVSRLNQAPEAWHLGYLLAPRINAGGRVGDSSLGTKLLLSHDSVEAGHIAESLDQLNKERQAIEQVCVQEAEIQAEKMLEQKPDQPVLVVYSSKWHPGVVGLIASRLKERFRRPVFAFTLNEDGNATGSGRSIPEIDLGKLVRIAVDQGIVLKGGGHHMAAGLTLKGKDLPELNSFIENVLSGENLPNSKHVLYIDSLISPAGAEPSLLKKIAQAGPFGAGQPEPVFAFSSMRLTDVRELGSSGHIKFQMKAGDGKSIGGIAFRASQSDLGKGLLENNGKTVHAIGTLSLDQWAGRERVDLRIQDFSLAK